jgi:hypothetical protein
VVGAPGEVKTIELLPTLTVTGNRSPEGAESWAVSLGITGGSIRAFELEGVTVSTILDQDGDPATPPLSPYPLDLGSAWRSEGELATREDDPAREGAISLVVLGGPRKTVLQPNGTQRIGRVLVEVPVPREGDWGEVVLRFEDGFRSGGLPRLNLVNFTDSYAVPVLGECRFEVRPGTGGRQVPGDSSQDGALDLSDAVSLLGTLFLGSPERLPCGDGSATDPGNVELLDWQADGSVDISDVIALLQFLFLDGPPHALAPADPALGGCVAIEECSSRATCP